MIKTPLTADSDFPSYSILVDGVAIKDVYQVISIEVEKKINTISTAKVVILDGDHTTEKFDASESSDFIPGKEIEISFGYHSKNQTVFKGVIIGQRIKVKSRSIRLVSQLTLKCADEALKLTVGRKSKYFKDKKDSEIISTILADAGLKNKISSTDNKHKKIVQYDSTDWDFILSRAEVNGFLAICNDGQLEIGKPDFSSDPVIAVKYGPDTIDFAAELDSQVQVNSVSCASWDGAQLKKNTGTSVEPSINKHGNISGKKLADVLDTGVYTMQSTTPEDTAVLKSLANAKLQKLRLAKINGYVSFPGHVAPVLGKLIQLKGFGERFNGDAFISEIEHSFSGGTWITKVGFGLDAKFFSESKTLVSPPAMGVLPGIQGLQIGTVKQIDEDPDGEYRILVDVPMIEESGIGVWARLLHEYASEEYGTFFLPEVGDETVLGFLNEDPRFPIILGSLYGKKKKPPFTPEKKNNTKAIVTKSMLKLVFDEDKKSITVETPAGNKIALSDDEKSISLVDQNQNQVTLSESGIVLDSPKDIKITSKGKFSVDAMEVAITSKGDANIEGSNVSAKAKMAFVAQGSAQAALKASGQVEVKGAMVMIN
ncbi:MAG: type VI secretion system tip protein VgrG [Fulvivirga sp.]